jgi:hypothetical protein
VTAANYVADISSTLSLPASKAAVVAKEYPLSSYSSPAAALGAVGTDAIFGWPGFTASDQQALSLVPPRPHLETGYATEHHCSLWSTV